MTHGRGHVTIEVYGILADDHPDDRVPRRAINDLVRDAMHGCRDCAAVNARTSRMHAAYRRRNR